MPFLRRHLYGNGPEIETEIEMEMETETDRNAWSTHIRIDRMEAEAGAGLGYERRRVTRNANGVKSSEIPGKRYKTEERRLLLESTKRYPVIKREYEFSR